MRDAWLTIAGLAAVTYALKAFGPLLLGGDRKLPDRVTRLAEDLPGPLLAALVAISTFADGTTPVVDSRIVGLVVAAVALWRKLPFVVVVVLAATATAAARAL